MKKVIILLAGYPGTGKTYLCNKILEKEVDFKFISQDEVKENLFDEIGFNNIEEKEELIERSRNEFYDELDKNMAIGNSIISDYPFSYKQKDRIENLASKYSYQIVTIRLTGDIDVIYKRRIKRDMKADRHIGHMVSSYHKGDVLKNNNTADYLITYDDFIEICKNRGYNSFSLGYLIEVDVTDFDKVDYDKVIKEIQSFL